MLDFTGSLLSGLRATQAALDAAANNIANARTPGYKRVVVTNSEGPAGGVRANVGRDPAPGPPYVDDLYDSLGNSPALGAPIDATAGEGDAAAAGGAGEVREASNVDLANELVNMQQASRSFALMARALKRGDDALGSLLDLFA